MKKIFGEANWNALRPVFIWTLFVLLPAGIFAWFDKPILNWVIDHAWIKWSLFWILFALFCGWAEALLIHTLVKLNYNIPGKIHSIFNALRSFVWIPMGFLAGWINAAFLIGVWIWCHDGNYYRVRHKQNRDIYKSGWWSNPSSSSKAVLDKFLVNWVRNIVFVVCVWGLIYFNRTDLW